MAFRLFFVLIFCFQFAQAQQKSELKPVPSDSRVPIDSTKMTKLTYTYAPWNQDPSKVESATIILREGKTGHIVQISLEETDKDSSIFSGLYSINWNSIEALSPEFYIPPQELFADEKDGLNKITEMIKSGDLRRKPFILRRSKTGIQEIEIFDSRDQAKLAMRAFRAENELSALRSRPQISTGSFDSVALEAATAERKRTSQSLVERAKISATESTKAQQALRAFENLSPAQKEQSRKQADQTAKSGFADYKANKNESAIHKFEEAIKADPQNKLYYFQYAVALYKSDKFNHSLVMLDFAVDNEKKSDVRKVEVDYYLGLNNYRLKLYQESLAYFDRVVATQDDQLSASSLLYKGIAQFEQLNFKPAQESFQAVLDNSKDPQIDARAEGYLEQILRIQQFEAERSKKWYVAGTVGAMYDSNIIYESDTSVQSSPTNANGERLLTVGTLRYRPVYEVDHEFAVQLDITNIYSVDTSFKYSGDIHIADPFLVDFTLPYSIKGVFLGKGYKLDLVPGYESLTLSVDNDSAKVIQKSFMLKAIDTVVMNDNWFANYNLELRDDRSNLNSSFGDDSESAINLKLTDGNLFFMNKEKSKIVTAEGSYTHNSAEGKNFIFDRLDLAGGYLTKSFWDTMFNTKLSYFLLNYSANANARLDNSYTLAAGFSKKLNDDLTAGLNANYNINASNVDLYTYKKYTVLLTLSYGKGF